MTTVENTQPQAPVAPQVPQMNVTQPQAPVAPQAPTTTQDPSTVPAGNAGGGYTIETVSKVTYTATQLFEVTGFLDVSNDWPSANAFVMFVPGQRDDTKASGRTYIQAQKEIMKISSREIIAMGEALKWAAMYNTCDYMTFTDSTKSSFHKEGQAAVKKISISVAPSNKDPNKYSIFLTYQGNQKITVVLDKWSAISLGDQLINLGQYTDRKKFEKETEISRRRRQG
jgi:ribonuclease HI